MPPGKEQLQHFVQRGRIRAFLVDQRTDLLQIRQQRGLELGSARLRPATIAFDGIDFTIVRQVTERLCIFPIGQCIGRKTLVEQANGRFQPWVFQVRKKFRQVHRHHQALVNRCQAGKCCHMERLVRPLEFHVLCCGDAPGDEKTPLGIVRGPPGRYADKYLFYTWHRIQRHLPADPCVRRHDAPTRHTQGFILDVFFENLA